jgi:hypothetical protein
MRVDTILIITYGLWKSWAGHDPWQFRVATRRYNPVVGARQAGVLTAGKFAGAMNGHGAC